MQPTSLGQLPDHNVLEKKLSPNYYYLTKQVNSKRKGQTINRVSDHLPALQKSEIGPPPSPQSWGSAVPPALSRVEDAHDKSFCINL